MRAELDELAVAERVLERMNEQLADKRAAAAPTPGQVGGQTVTLIPHRTPGMEDAALPPDYQRILAAVRQAAGPVMARQVGEELWPCCATTSAWRAGGNNVSERPPLARRADRLAGRASLRA
ncbi:hypothetical protein ACH4UM_19870 [Streptomyces sp. NPDC020801]|uniref:hypothetical protein n=1 Tax=unclassified Streptomyces TaxID=2593676 RepID=UPI0037A98ECA